jgi:subtilisin family serine protease
MEGVCGAPGSVLPIFAKGITDPERFRALERVQYRATGKNGETISTESRLVAASSLGVVTVIPPGLSGHTDIQISGPNGISNIISITVDPACTINQGQPLTEAELKSLGAQVTKDLKDRATDEDDLLNFIPGEVLVGINTTTQSAPQRQALQDKFGITVLQRLPGTSLFMAHLRDASITNTLATADALKQERGVFYASENGIQTLLQAPNDPGFPQQTYLQTINILSGWEHFFPTVGAGITIAIVDTGLDLTQKVELTTPGMAPDGVDVSEGQELSSILLGTASADDRKGHGTITGSIAGARGNNGIAGVGVAYNATILPIKVFGADRFASQATIGLGIIVAYLLGSDVINMSLGCARCKPNKDRQSRLYFANLFDMLQAAFAEIRAPTPIMVGASGNDSENDVDAPAADRRVIAVGSINGKTMKRSSFSNYGPELDFVAPGENITTSMIGGQFGNAGSGTSFATPQVAGLVALMLATEPNLKLEGVDRVRELIRECFVKHLGDQPGRNDETGWGMIYIPSPQDVDVQKCLHF